jgi:hypothetical protein
LIGATRETVTLTLGQLQDEKLIRVQRRRLAVLDRPRLAAEAAGDTAALETHATAALANGKPLRGAKNA